MKRILVHVVLVIQFFVIFFMMLFDQSVSNNVRKLFSSKNTMAPYNAEMLKPKPPDLRSIPPEILEDLQERLPNLPVINSLSVKSMASVDSDSKCFGTAGRCPWFLVLTRTKI